MKLLLDSFWRAGAYCLHPKVIALSLLPLLIGVALALGLGWFYWEAAVAGVRATLENWLLVDAALRWVENLVGSSFRAVLAPLIVVALAADRPSATRAGPTTSNLPGCHPGSARLRNQWTSRWSAQSMTRS